MPRSVLIQLPQCTGSHFGSAHSLAKQLGIPSLLHPFQSLGFGDSGVANLKRRATLGVYP